MSDVPQINVNVVDGLPEAPQDSVIYGRRNAAWVDMTSPANLVFSLGNAAEVAAYTPLDGEPVWDSESKVLYVGDGQTQGGILVGRPEATAYQGAAAAIPASPSYSNATPVTLGPQDSVWEINYTAVFGGGFDIDNTLYTAKVGDFSGLSAIDGELTYIDSGNNVTRKLIQSSEETFPVGDGLPCLLRISGLIRVTGSSGTVSIGLQADPEGEQVSNGLARSAIVCRRIA
jgi:hypothetical protein